MLTINDLQIIVNVLFSHIVVGIDRTKLSRAGEECFGDLNLPAWPCPFSYMGKILTFNRKVIRTYGLNLFTKIIAMATFNKTEKMSIPRCSLST